jgi:hypothetical protein
VLLHGQYTYVGIQFVLPAEQPPFCAPPRLGVPTSQLRTRNSIDLQGYGCLGPYLGDLQHTRQRCQRSTEALPLWNVRVRGVVKKVVEMSEHYAYNRTSLQRSVKEERIHISIFITRTSLSAL